MSKKCSHNWRGVLKGEKMEKMWESGARFLDELENMLSMTQMAGFVLDCIRLSIPQVRIYSAIALLIYSCLRVSPTRSTPYSCHLASPRYPSMSELFGVLLDFSIFSAYLVLLRYTQNYSQCQHVSASRNYSFSLVIPCLLKTHENSGVSSTRGFRMVSINFDNSGLLLTASTRGKVARGISVRGPPRWFC